MAIEVVDHRLVGADPALPGIGAAPAIEALLCAHGLSVMDIDVVDIVEAYAAQVLAACQHLGLDPSSINRHGGALAHGHPWAASGAIAFLTTLDQLASAPAGTLGITGSSDRRWHGCGGVGEKTMIELENVMVTVKPEAVLLDDVSARLEAPTTAIIGENGSGKSTLAKVLAGLIDYTGSAKINDVEVATGRKKLSGRVGMIIANAAAQVIMPTVAEDVGLSLRHLPKHQRQTA